MVKFTTAISASKCSWRPTAAHGGDYEVEVMRSAWVLSDAERRRIIMEGSYTTVGRLDADILSGWPERDLLDAGIDDNLLREMDADTATVRVLLEAREEPIDYEKMWEGMPEFEQEDGGAIQKIIVHFAARDDVKAFGRLLEQPLTEKTRSIWYPRLGRTDRTLYKCEDES